MFLKIDDLRFDAVATQVSGIDAAGGLDLQVPLTQRTLDIDGTNNSALKIAWILELVLASFRY